MALTTDFIAAVRRQGSIPSSFTSADVLALGDAEIQGRFIPLLESLRQNYFVREVTASPDARGRVALPARAIGAALRSVQLFTGASWVSLPLRDLGDSDFVSSGAPSAYALDGGSIILLPTGTSGTLRIRYSARPGRMCLDTDTTLARVISAVGAPGATTTALTSSFTGALALCDVISAGPAHQQKAINTTFGGSQPNLTVPNVDCLEQPAAGDYVAAGDRSPFVPLPEELYAALVHSVAANILLSLAYLQEASAQQDKADRLTGEARLYLMPRNVGNPKTVRGGLMSALRGRR